MREYTLFRETRTTRKVTFRADRYGLYLLCWERGCLAAGVSYQWPNWLQRKVNGEDAARHLNPGLSGFSWGPDVVEFLDHSMPAALYDD